ncbi:MAG: hypothetical protein AAFP82_09780 [Bacteroidota bacterium]
MGIGVFYLLIAIIFPSFKIGKSLNTEIDSLQSELMLGLTSSDAVEERAERLFKSHEIDLKKYYDQALSHSASIFFAGIICLGIGFAFIGASIFIITKSNFHESMIAMEKYDKILVAILGTVSGILTNFIGAIFLKMYSETIKSLRTFHEKLVSTNHLHFSNFLISKIENKRLRENTLKEISILIANNKISQ